MAGSPRNTVKLLYQKLQEQYKSEAGLRFGKEREVLEYLVFAIFLENTPIKSAETAFDLLEEYFIDWNEIRVSTTGELVDVLNILPFAQRAGERVRRTLQWIFETTYKFDLEDWRKKEVGEFQTFLASNPYSTHFMNDFVLHFVFNQTPIPFDEGAMRTLRLLDLVEIDDENKEQVRGVERTFSRQDADQFFTLLHQFGSEMMSDPENKKNRKLLKAIDAESEVRSWIPLVETDVDQDPAAIARAVASKQVKRPKPSMLIDIDEELIEESMEVDFLVENEEGELIPQDSAFDADRDELPQKPERGEESSRKKPKETAAKSAKSAKSNPVEKPKAKAAASSVRESAPKTEKKQEPKQAQKPASKSESKSASKSENAKAAPVKEKTPKEKSEKKVEKKTEKKSEKTAEKQAEKKAAKPSVKKTEVPPPKKTSAKPEKKPAKSAAPPEKKSTSTKKAVKKSLPPPDPPAKGAGSHKSAKKK